MNENNQVLQKIPVSDLLQDLQNKNTHDFSGDFVSSHWKKYGPAVKAELTSAGFSGRACGFDDLRSESVFLQVIRFIERLSYWPVTRKMADFEQTWGIAKRLLTSLELTPNYYAFRTAATASVISCHFRKAGFAPESILIIGDGNGFLGAILKDLFPNARLFLVDFPQMLMFQGDVHSRIAKARGHEYVENLGFFTPEELEEISGPIELAVNIASMQEMSPSTVAGYFSFIRSRANDRSRFYCVNRTEKFMPGGEVSRFSDYPWLEEDKIILDGPCPYYTHFFQKGRTLNGPTFLGVKIPWVHYFDGEVRHRLIQTAKKALVQA